MLDVGVCSLNKNQNIKDNFDLGNFVIDSICDFSRDIIAVLNGKKEIIICSKEFQNLFAGYNLLGQNFSKIMSKIVRMPNDFWEHQSYFIKAEYDENEKVFLSQISAYKQDNGSIDRYIVVLKDVTEKKELEAQRDNFIATLTHDLKTPVRADIMSLELLLKGKFGCLNIEQKEIIEELLNSNKFMMAMLDTLLTKYKYESGVVELNKTLFDLNEMVQEAAKALQCLFDERNVSLKFKLSEKKIPVYADKLELKRALSNLITNAIKFNKINGKVIIYTTTIGEYAQVKVEDTGIGISKEKLLHIFDKYVSYAKRYRQLGTGLGLYVAKKIAELHNGQIEVSSLPQKGSTFLLKIPVAEEN